MKAGDVLERYRREIGSCTYCPKLCRDVCPIGIAEARETTTTWGMMQLLGLVLDGVDDLDAEKAEVFHRCLGCRRCREACLLHIEVAPALRAGRVLAVARGLEPPGARRIAEEWRARADRLGAALRAVVPATMLDDPSAEAVFLPGCEAIEGLPEAIEDALEVLAALGGRRLAVYSGGDCGPCCGAPLLEAGYLDLFRDHARRVAARLGSYRTVIVADAVCGHTLLGLRPDHDIAPPLRVLHLSQHLRRAIEERPPARCPASGERLVYHDPCALARLLDVRDDPRRVLEWATGAAPLEARASGLTADCCGAAGTLRETAPAVAAAVAERRLAALWATGADGIVTASPRCVRHFRAQAGERAARVHELVSVVRRAL